MRQIRTLMGASLICFVSLSSVAQWQWIDQNGRRVYSDRPPPPEIPQKNIVRQAGATRPDDAPTPSANSEPSATASPQSVPAAGQPADPKALEKGRLEKQAESNKRKAEEDKINQIRAENCQRAQRGVMSYSSGARIFIINPQGEREVLDDSTRELELQRLHAIIESDCSVPQ
ncbi:MAG: DUF4124 domain-containing protein [Burkholderiaceae bacterium]